MFSPAIIAGWLAGWIAAAITFPLQAVIAVVVARLYVLGRRGGEALVVNELPLVNLLFNLPIAGAAAVYAAILFVG